MEKIMQVRVARNAVVGRGRQSVLLRRKHLNKGMKEVRELTRWPVICRKSVSGNGNHQCKGPEVRLVSCVIGTSQSLRWESGGEKEER